MMHLMSLGDEIRETPQAPAIPHAGYPKTSSAYRQNPQSKQHSYRGFMSRLAGFPLRTEENPEPYPCHV